MEAAYTIGGGSYLMIKFQIGDTFPNAGVPAIAATDGEEGILNPSTTAAADQVGLVIDTQDTVVTAQQSDNSDPERLVTCIVNPDLVMRGRLSGSSTEGTDLTLYPVTTASTDGLTVTTGDSWTSTEFDEGTMWGYDGANAGIARLIATTGATAATCLVAFPYDTAVGDNFLRAPMAKGVNQTFSLTDAFYEIDASAAESSGTTNFQCLDLVLNDAGGEGRAKSYALIVSKDHLFAGQIT